MTRDPVCAECGEPIEDIRHHKTTLSYCSDKCRYRNRDRRRYEADPEGQRAKSRDYYRRNREKKLAAVKAYQARKREERGE